MSEKEDIRDLTTGSVWRKLYRFALPILFTNLLQAVYNVVDMIIVGRFLGSAGITAVNVGGQVVMVVFVIISAFSYVLSNLTPLDFNGIAVAYVLAPCASLTVSGLYTLSGRWKKPRVILSRK
ncbi:MAG: oligosaccharide flippase family protein [Clostridiales bacterium]|nr:oligosaccharide flippase family protein [Clostridiales bacterium]